jgi:hypothetical protein
MRGIHEPHEKPLLEEEGVGTDEIDTDEKEELQERQI